MVLLGAEAIVQQDRRAPLSNSSRIANLALGTINLRLGAVRRLAYEAADCGLLSPDLAASIRRVKGVKKIGVRLGNWLTAEQSQRLWQAPGCERLQEKRDRALLAVLLACGLRRHEAVGLNLGHIQQREEHWATVDLKGKAGHTRTIPMPGWVKNVVDQWIQAANITSGKLFRRAHKMGKTWGEKLTEKAVWHVVRQHAVKADIHKLALHQRNGCFKKVGSGLISATTKRPTHFRPIIGLCWHCREPCGREPEVSFGEVWTLPYSPPRSVSLNAAIWSLAGRGQGGYVIEKMVGTRRLGLLTSTVSIIGLPPRTFSFLRHATQASNHRACHYA